MVVTDECSVVVADDVAEVRQLLEDALIKLSSVATNMMGVSGRLMIEALIAGERDPRVLADLAALRVAHEHPGRVLIVVAARVERRVRGGDPGQAVVREGHAGARDRRHDQGVLLNVRRATT